jgi:type I protein arginine methyltransferase
MSVKSYSIWNYGRMIRDTGRMDAYTKALCEAVQPNAVVLDIGTGTGIFSMLACQFGARKVYAIDPTNAIQVAREMAVANGYANRIEFIQALSTDVSLPEPVDVIISDLRGVLPLFQNHIHAIADARQRFLKPDGILIPQQDILWAVVVEAPDLYEPYAIPWEHNSYGLDMSAARQFVENTWGKGRVAPEQFLVEPQAWTTLDYTTIENPDVRAELTWTMTRSGTAHGLVIWFDATLIAGVQFTNAPGTPELIYSSAFFPWAKPVTLMVGDIVTVSLQADLVGEDYIWGWNACVRAQEPPQHIKAQLKQSTFWGEPLSALQLRKQAASYVPTLNEDGQIDHFILELISQGTVLSTIADQVFAQFPKRFATHQDALTQVGSLSQKYSE